MNQWPVYSYMKMTWRRTGRIPTKREVVSEFPRSSMAEIREGMLEFKLAYERSFSKEGHVPENLSKWHPLVEKMMQELVDGA